MPKPTRDDKPAGSEPAQNRIRSADTNSGTQDMVDLTLSPSPEPPALTAEAQQEPAETPEVNAVKQPGELLHT